MDCRLPRLALAALLLLSTVKCASKERRSDLAAPDTLASIDSAVSSPSSSDTTQGAPPEWLGREGPFGLQMGMTQRDIPVGFDGVDTTALTRPIVYLRSVPRPLYPFDLYSLTFGAKGLCSVDAIGPPLVGVNGGALFDSLLVALVADYGTPISDVAYADSGRLVAWEPVTPRPDSVLRVQIRQGALKASRGSRSRQPQVETAAALEYEFVNLSDCLRDIFSFLDKRE